MQTSALLILRKFRVSSGYLFIDDEDVNRSKGAKKLHHLHKMRDKKTGDSRTKHRMLYFITEKVNIPVGFSFYCPDPIQKKWRFEIKLCKKRGIAKKLHPKQPKQLEDYLKKYELAIGLLKALFQR